MLDYQEQLVCPICGHKNIYKDITGWHSRINCVDCGYQFSNRQLYLFVMDYEISQLDRVSTTGIKFR